MGKTINEGTLTAYILQELSGRKRAAVEKELGADPDARREADELRAAAGVCARAVKGGPDYSLKSEQRGEILARIESMMEIVPREARAGSSFGGAWGRYPLAGMPLRFAGMGFALALVVMMALWFTISQMNIPLEYWCFRDSGSRERSCVARLSLSDGDGLTEGGYPFAGDTETYDHIVDNPFLEVARNPLSTFSIDVDTASYANLRRFINEGALPPPGAVRIEEMINYFPYRYLPPEGDIPFSADVAAAGCPWDPEHRLVRVALKGREIPPGARPPSNLVFLIDVSGSMQDSNKLPLLKRAMRLLAEQIRPEDRVAMAVYAGASGLVLPSTPGYEREKIMAALESLEAGGCTNGGAGLKLAYDTASAQFITAGVNRVILATDGDFNVGITSQDELIRLLEKEAKRGIALTVLGFGMGNLKDSTLEKLADRGNGNYAYIDSLDEARKVLVNELGGTLVTIAKDVKIQVEFNPREALGYRLIGYENRLLRAEEFDDDAKDAGEIGAGHTVTAIYEVIPAGASEEALSAPRLKYQGPPSLSGEAESGELLTLKIRYKDPGGDESQLLEFPVIDSGDDFAAADPDFKFAAAVAAFGMLLRDSPYKGNATLESVRKLAEEGRGEDADGYRAGFIELVEKAGRLSR